MKEAEQIFIPNYQLTARLGASPQSIIYKGFDKRRPDSPLVLKVLKVTYLPEHQKRHYRQKIEQLKTLHDPALVTPISFATARDFHFITREYFEGEPLNEWAAQKKKISLNDFFTVSKFLAQALVKVHDAGIIHGGVKPHNILIDPRTLSVRLVDFISALDVTEVSHFIYDRSFVTGSLAYTSPEQTGRISHRVTVSSDLYSLGIVFYELLTGRLPFFSLDPLELIHSHLAEEAEHLAHELNPEVPQMVGEMIAKLIRKQPEKRYRSAAGLLADLERCRREYLATGDVKPFALGAFDLTRQITFVSKMVGRDNEAKAILEDYDRAAAGPFSSVFISGLPGIGKTRLIQELQRPIVKHKGYFTSGKFDVYQKNIPYSSLIQALRNLIRTFLTESDERLVAWKRRILEAVGRNGRVLTDVIPELEILIGGQRPVQPLPPVESRNRFNDVFNAFLISVATEEHPLALFIDDLQWCDLATFDFLANVFANHRDHRYLFFLGAYRHNEVDESHPLTKLIGDIKKTRSPLKEIRLAPLEPKHCHEMVSYILDVPLTQTRELAEFVTNLSGGNPLFVSETLSYLNNENLLNPDENGHWRWDMEGIRETYMPPTVVGLFGAKVKKLPRETIELLEFCACIGNRFSPTELAMVKDIALLNAFEMLKPALAFGLLMETKDDFQFVHDRVQEAVLVGIDEEKRRRIHWTVGTRLHSAAGDALAHADNLFAIAAHLNLGREARLDPQTARAISDVNYHAGNKALDALATDAANSYFRLARELLPEESWETQYERTFDVLRKAAKTELMNGNYAESAALIDQLLENAKTELDKAEALAEQATSLSSIGDFSRAIETANRGLAYFGKEIPETPGEVDARREAFLAEIASRDIDIRQTILDMPFTTDREKRVETAFYSELSADLYLSGRVEELFLIGAQATLHCLDGGMDEAVMYGFTAMAIYFAVQNDFEQSFVYEDLTYDLAAKYPNTFAATKCMTGAVFTLMHARSRPKEIADYSLKAIQSGKSAGDMNNAGYSYAPLTWSLQAQGADLSLIEKYAKECLQFAGKYHLGVARSLAEAVMAGWVEPMKKGYVPVSDEENLERWKKSNHVAALTSYYVLKALEHYYFGEHEEAERYLVDGREYLRGITNGMLVWEWHLFVVLNALRLHERGVKYRSEDELLAHIQPLVEKVETWARLGPLLKPFLALLHAERERVLGAPGTAAGLYLGAIAVANEHGYTFLEGYLNECLARFLDEEPGRRLMAEIVGMGLDGEQAHAKTAGVFFREAASLYRKCGAERKEFQLLSEYGRYFVEEEAPPAPPEEAEAAFPLRNLDIAYLLKSSLAISSETEERALLDKIMSVALESSGARDAYLIFAENGDLVVRAESHVTGEKRVRLAAEKIEEVEGVNKAIARYVYRTNELVALENASEAGPFKDNPEVREMSLRSVLCLPVIKQNRLIGVLYLENRLAEGVFDPARTEMTKLMMNQAAISIDNARLVDRLKLDIARRERAQLLRDALSGIDTVIRAAPDVRAVMAWVIDEAVKAIGCEQGSLMLRSDGRWVPEYAHGLPPQPTAVPLTDEQAPYPALAAKTKKTVVARDTFEDDRVDRTLMQRYGIRSILAVPLVAREEVIGAFSFTNRSAASEFAESEIDFAERLGKAVSLAFESSRLMEVERALKERQLLAAVVESSSDAIISQTLEGIITSWNQAAERMYGHRSSEAIGRSINIIIPPDRPEEARLLLQRIAQGERVENFETHRVRKDGTVINVSVSISPVFNAAGEIVGAATVARDITERLRAEKALHQANEQLTETLEELRATQAQIIRAEKLAALGTLTAGVAHELNNPLTGLLTFIQYAIAHTADRPKVNTVLHDADEAARRMGRIVNSLLAEASGDRRAARLGAQVASVALALERVVLLLGYRITKENIEMRSEVPENLPTVAIGDDPLQEILLNLLTNAFDATESTDQKRVEVTAIEREGVVEITVSDSGEGIPEALQNRIMEPFFTTKEVGKGSGLGLWIVSNLLREYGGSLSFWSRAGEGARFTVSLPRAVKEVQ